MTAKSVLEEVRKAGHPVFQLAGRAGAAIADHAAMVAALVLVVGGAAVLSAWRRHGECLRDREAVTLLPTDTFSPSLEEVARFWAGPIAETRRPRQWYRRRAEAVRFCLSARDGGLVTETLGASHRALALLEPNVPYQVELERPEGATDGDEDAECEPRRRSRRGSRRRSSPLDAGTAEHSSIRSRAELSISPDQTHSLAALTLNPDPLTPLAGALADLAEGEAGYVAIDLQPLSGRQIKAARRKARSRDKTRPDWTKQLTSGQFLNDDPLSKTTARSTAAAGPVGALKRIEARAETMTDYDRFASGEPVFAAQLLIWAEAPSKARSRQIVEQLVTGLSPMAQRAHWRRTGFHMGPIHLGGAESPSRRWWFDHRADTGCHRPAKPSIVGASEIAGLIKPPTANCHVSKVLRGGGAVPPPPPGLPTWTPGAEGMLPLGEVTERGVKRWVGVWLADTFFTMMFGRSRFGKTFAAMNQMVALARQRGVPGGRPSQLRPGFAFLDPHGDGVDDLKRYLVADADRVQIVDLRRRKDAKQAGWNPLCMVGRDADEVEDIVSMLVTGFSAVLGWTEVNNRAQNLVTQSVASLCTLNLVLPPELQATLFQIPTILTDEDWRKEILRFLTPHQRTFWTSRLATQTDTKTATSPVTNLVDRIRSTNQMVGLFGQSVSTFDLRTAMDDGKILLLCPGGAGATEGMVHVLLIFGMFLASASRQDVKAEDRRTFHAFLDEMQIADKGAGSTYIARSCQELAKFGFRLHAMAQQPNALTKTTLAALADNRSLLSSTTVGSESAAWLAKELGGEITAATVTRIPRWNRIAMVSLHGTPSLPFRIRNLSMVEAWGEPATDAEVAALEEAVDRSMRRQPITDVVRHLDTLDARILDQLRGTPPPSGEMPPLSPRPVRSPVLAGSPTSSTRRRRARVEVPAADGASADAVGADTPPPGEDDGAVQPVAVGPAIPPEELPDGVASITRERRKPRGHVRFE